MRRICIGIVVLALIVPSAPALADIAVEFGRGATKLLPLNIDETSAPSNEMQAVVIDFFQRDNRDLAAFLCYEAELRDLQNRKVRGYGVDCLGINPVISTPLVGPLGTEHGTPGGPVNGDALSPQIDAITFFFFPGGHFVADGLTTVRPIFDGVGDGKDAGGNPGPFGAITHITGSIPGAGSYISEASGRYRKLAGKGRVRLSGAVNTDDFFSNLSMSFSCYFTILNGKGRGHGGGNK